MPRVHSISISHFYPSPSSRWLRFTRFGFYVRIACAQHEFFVTFSVFHAIHLICFKIVISVNIKWMGVVCVRARARIFPLDILYANAITPFTELIQNNFYFEFRMSLSNARDTTT